VGKLHALDAVDAELRAIERVLGDHREIVELKEPGITACVRCGALNGTDARFCSACGTQVDGPVSVAGAPPAAAAGSTAAHLPQTPATTTPQPAPQPGSAPPTAVVAPPVPPSGPAPAAPPLWSVPQQQPVESEPDKNTAGPDQP
jgi:ribosomal protein L40E